MSVSNAILGADSAQPKAQVALSESPIYELRDLQVETTQDGLLISGSVDSFYHKQLAQEAVRAVVGKVPMINRIHVRSQCEAGLLANSWIAAQGALTLKLQDYIRSIPDFPKPGINFRDITPLLADPQALQESIRQLAEHYGAAKVDVVAAAEARGFIFAAPLAIELGVGFVPIRKPGKLPFETHAFHYELEYGTDTLEIHIDGVTPGQRVLLVDDLLATGGTIEACCKLVEKANATVAGCAFVIELADLGGAKRLAGYETFSLVKY